MSVIAYWVSFIFGSYRVYFHVLKLFVKCINFPGDGFEPPLEEPDDICLEF